MKKTKISMICFSVIAIILEIIPFGAVLNFVDDGITIRKTFSYFSLTPFGYANFAPFIVALLTCVLFVLSVIYVIKNKKSLRKAISVVSLVSVILSLAPLLYGVDYFTVVAGFISAVLLVNFTVSLFIRNSEIDV